MVDREKVIKGLTVHLSNKVPPCDECPYANFEDTRRYNDPSSCSLSMMADALALLKEQEKKRITLHKKHVITWSRTDEFSMRKLYEAVCETLLDEGELFIARTDDHEKVDFVFYVTEVSVKWE